MYHRYYGLRELPFELTCDPKFLLLTGGQREALSNLEYGLSSSKPLTVLIGEAGTGKTTLLRAALDAERCRHVRCVYINNPALTRDEFLATLGTAVGLARPAASKPALLAELEALLRDRRVRNETTALIVDEAQCLSTELLEEIRLLGNIETSAEKLLPLVLAGQPELGARLEQPELRQLKQRVVLRCQLLPFSLRETAAYIVGRIRAAGGTPSALFSQEAVTIVHDFSRGIARTISVICDNALVSGMALGRRPVDREIVLEVCRDLALTRHDDGAPQAAGDGAQDDRDMGASLPLDAGASPVALFRSRTK